jgi:hypothetical protein
MLHFTDGFLSGVAQQVVHMHGQLERLFVPAQILPRLVQIRQHGINEAPLSECFIWIEELNGYLSLTPKKTMTFTFQIGIVFCTMGGTSSRNEGYVEV